MNMESGASTATPRWRLRLYVVGDTHRSQLAFQNLQALCAAHLHRGDYRIEVVDLLSDPDSARADNIIVTPTTVRMQPPPQIQVIGDLSDMARAGSLLGLTRAAPNAGLGRATETP